MGQQYQSSEAKVGEKCKAERPAPAAGAAQVRLAPRLLLARAGQSEPSVRSRAGETRRRHNKFYQRAMDGNVRANITALRCCPICSDVLPATGKCVRGCRWPPRGSMKHQQGETQGTVTRKRRTPGDEGPATRQLVGGCAAPRRGPGRPRLSAPRAHTEAAEERTGAAPQQEI